MDDERIIFLVVGVVIVLIIGRLLVFSGQRYLTNTTASTNSDTGPQTAAAQPRSAGSAATLVAVLFHLLTLGIVALLAVLPIGVSGLNGLLLRLGILLIALALVYGITLMLLSRRRQEAMAVEIDALQKAPDRPRTGVRVEPLAPNESARGWSRNQSTREWGQPVDPAMDPAGGTATGQPRPDHSL